MPIIERYLAGEMTEEERLRFELLRKDNAAIDGSVTEHRNFIAKLKQYSERLEFECLLNTIHEEIDVQALKEEFVHHPSRLVRIWRNHHSKISLAASIAIFAVFSTLFFTGYLKDQTQESTVQDLRKRVDSYKRSTENFRRSTDRLIHDINTGGHGMANGKYSGTGFAISTDGYIVTNAHVINGADSVYIQNADGDAYRVKTVYTDPAYDIAILKITDPNFKPLAALPYAFKRSSSAIGEDVFTIGYPKNDAVYDRGYLSSATGFNGDTIRYQVSIPVNPGNSGGPVIDNHGNIVGVISGKQTLTDGAAFAIKSNYLIKAIKAIPADSLQGKLNLNTHSSLANMSRTAQIDKLQNYIFMVKVYNN